MSMKLKLIVVTSSYPYGIGEAFFATELEMLSTQFDEILLLPLRKSGGHVRLVPENVRIVSPGREGHLINFLPYLFQLKTLTVIVKECLALRKTEGWITNLQTVILSALWRTRLEGHETILAAKRDPKTYIYYSYWGITGPTVIPLLSHSGVPTCVRYHGSDLYGNRGKAIEYFPSRKDIIRNTKLSVFVSEDGLRYFENTWAEEIFSEGDRIVSYLGSTPHDLSKITRSPGDSSLTVCSCAFIRPLKRIGLVYELCRRLAEQRPVTWVHFGGGQDPDLAERMSGPVEGLTVRLLGDMSHSEIMDYYSRWPIDLFVSLSSAEGLPISIVEALSYNIPCLATDVGGVREAVVTGKTGLLIGSDDALELDALARRVEMELKPGGVLRDHQARCFWQQKFNGRENALRFGAKLVALHDV